MFGRGDRRGRVRLGHRPARRAHGQRLQAVHLYDNRLPRPWVFADRAGRVALECVGGCVGELHGTRRERARVQEHKRCVREGIEGVEAGGEEEGELGAQLRRTEYAGGVM